MTSPYAFYQFWLNADDARRGRRTCGCFTFRSREEIEELERATARAAGGARGPARAGRGLTDAGARRGRAPARWSPRAEALFGQGTWRPWTPRRSRDAVAELPRRARAAGLGPPVVDLLAETGLVASKSAARRTITEGGAYVNNVKVADEEAPPAPASHCTAAGCCCAGDVARWAP